MIIIENVGGEVARWVQDNYAVPPRTQTSW